MMEQMPKAVPFLNNFAINKIYLFLYPFAIYPALLIIGVGQLRKSAAPHSSTLQIAKSYHKVLKTGACCYVSVLG